MSFESMMPSSHLILCHPFLFLSPIPPSIRVFSNESTLSMKWPKYWSFSFSISPSSEHPGLISFKMDWLALLAVQGTLKSLLQHHSSKASILRHSAFFTVQLNHVQLFVTPWIAAHQASLSITNSESTQTHVHWVGDAIQPSHPLSSPSPPALNLSQHQRLFKWVSSSQKVAKILEFQHQHHSFQWLFRTDFL